jgi:lysyl-tRNA synthetase class 2
MQAIRRFFIERDYLEVDTPIRIPAPAPEAHIDAMATADQFLQTSPELCMKQLLAAGFPRIFQICKCFRHQERGRRHLPELTMLEWYHAGNSYLDLMEECEDLICFIAHHLGRGDRLIYRDRPIGLAKPWPRLAVAEAFEQYGSQSLEAALATNSLAFLTRYFYMTTLPLMGHWQD